MSKQEFNDFKAKANAVHLPDSVKKSVMAQAAEHEQPQSVEAPASSRPRTAQPRALAPTGGAAAHAGVRTGLWRRVGLAACAAAVAVGVGVFGVSALNNTLGTVAESGNWFELTAYAEGTPSEGDTSVKQAFGNSSSSSGWEHGWRNSYSLDFSVKGDGIKTIEYSLEGEYVGDPEDTEEYDKEVGDYVQVKPVVYMEYYGSREGIGEGDALLTDDNATYKGFTIDYETMAENKDLFQRNISVEYTSTDEINECWFAERDNLESMSEAEQEALDAKFDKLRIKRAGKYLSATQLVLKVTYGNGDMQTKRYQISLADNWEEIYEHNEAQRDSEDPEFKYLYTLTEVE